MLSDPKDFFMIFEIFLFEIPESKSLDHVDRILKANFYF